MRTAIFSSLLIAGADTLPNPQGFGDLGGLMGGGSSGGGLGGLGSLLGGGSGSTGHTGVAGEGSSSGGLGGLGGFRGMLGRLGGSGGGSNDVQDGQCKDVTLIFARGTGESSTMGFVVGPPLASAMREQIVQNCVAVQGVDYSTDFSGSGAGVMADLANKAVQQCPNTRLVLSGHSQGAMVVHQAAGQVPAERVAAVVTFGDPFKSQGVDNIPETKYHSYCSDGDAVCLGGGDVGAGPEGSSAGGHLSYSSDIGPAVQFIQSNVGGAAPQ